MAWCVAIIAWTLAGASNDACTGTYNQVEACRAGLGIGILFSLGIGFFGFVLLSIIRFMTRPKCER